jgi:hypothetical protein
MDLARNLIGRINVGDSLTRSAAARPGGLAVVDGDRRLTYEDFNAYGATIYVLRGFDPARSEHAQHYQVEHYEEG